MNTGTDPQAIKYIACIYVTIISDTVPRVHGLADLLAKCLILAVACPFHFHRKKCDTTR